MWILSDDQLEGLRTGYQARLVQMDHPDGAIRLSTLPFDWTDSGGSTWLGGERVLSISDVMTELGVAAGVITIAWNGASEDLVASSQVTDVEGSRVRVWRAIFHGEPPELAGAPRLDFTGTCERPSLPPVENNAEIRIEVQSDLLLLNGSRPFRFTPDQLRAYSPDDTFFDRVATLAAGVEV